MTARIVATLAALFGLATLVAGMRVMGGADPGYVVFPALLVFNTIMGAVYVVAAVVIWRNPRRGRTWARTIAVTNLAVLLVIIIGLYTTGAAVAVDSLAAMSLRTLAWGLALLALWRTR